MYINKYTKSENTPPIFKITQNSIYYMNEISHIKHATQFNFNFNHNHNLC